MRAPNCGASRCCMESRPPYPRGQALVDSSSLRYGEKASYYSAVCLETDEVEWMELDGNSNSGTSAGFPGATEGETYTGPLTVIWDNAPAHRGEAVREYIRTPGLKLRLVNPRFHEGRLCWVTVLTSTPMRRSGDRRERRGDRGPVPGQQGRGAGESRQIPGRAVQRERRGETALPDDPAIKGPLTPASLPAEFLKPCKCTFHFGLGVVRGGRLGHHPLGLQRHRGLVSRTVHHPSLGNFLLLGSNRCPQFRSRTLA